MEQKNGTVLAGGLNSMGIGLLSSYWLFHDSLPTHYHYL